jgi:hypothetical protein
MAVEVRVSSPGVAANTVVGRRTHAVRVNAAGLTTPEQLFGVLADGLDFPGYFGHNWDALDECFTDYFQLVDGGLGSAFGGRAGIDADAVRLDVAHAGALLRAGLLDRFARTVRYAQESNADVLAADLELVLEVDDGERDGVVRVLAAIW